MHYANNVSGSGDIEKDGQGSEALSPEITTASPPPADSLTVSFDDSADTVTVTGIDTDLTGGLVISLVDPLSSNDPKDSEALTVANVAVSNGTATIAYADLKAAITSANPDAKFTELAVQYAADSGNSIEKDGFGIKALSSDVMGSPLADTLTTTFDNTADAVTCEGIKTDMHTTDLHLAVVNQ